MRSAASSVDSYLAEVPQARQAILRELRAACLGLLTSFDEHMNHGMPSYARDGVDEIAWASQKQYISLYVLRSDVLSAHRAKLANLSVGKGCIRYRDSATVDFSVIRSMLSAVAASDGPVC